MDDKPIGWDECFMEIAKTMSKRSKDPNTKTGAVIVDEHNKMIGSGYNGFPRGIRAGVLPWKREGTFLETKYAYVVHAEENAIYTASRITEGCRIYTTLFPCNECAKAIIQSGIKEVIYAEDKYKGTDSVKASKRMFGLSGVTVRKYAN